MSEVQIALVSQILRAGQEEARQAMQREDFLVALKVAQRVAHQAKAVGLVARFALTKINENLT